MPSNKSKPTASEKTTQGDESSSGSSTTFKDVLSGTEFLLRFDLQYSNRGTSATPDQLATQAKSSKTDVPGLPMSALRPLVTNMGSRDFFCLDDERQTVVSEKLTLTQYLSSTPTNVTVLKSYDPDTVTIFTVFIAKSRVRPSTADRDKAGTGPPISLQPSNNDGNNTSTSVPDDYKKSGLDSSQFAGQINFNEPVHPADMTEKEWDVVVKNNILTHAYKIDFSTNTTFVARRPAFKLKQRPPEVYVVSTESDDGTQITTTIPDFRVFDDSSVSVVEITNEAQKSAADNSFSSVAIQASLSGGIFGIAAGGSAGVSTSQSQGTASSSGTFESVMRVSYMFPRVIVFLDFQSLELTDESLKLLQRIDSATDDTERNNLVLYFKSLYGDVFSTEVQLGGYLHSTKLTSAIAASTVQEKMDRMKVSAGANFVAPAVTASFSAEYSQGSNSSDKSSSVNKHESLTWTAKGGDTLLCSNPPYWCSTVSDIYNWRVIERSLPRLIGDVISEMPGCQKYGAYLGVSQDTQAQQGSTVYVDSDSD